MCNGKGWDIAFYPDDEITVEQHFCRVYGDCGHDDNTLEEAAEQVAAEYRREYDWHRKAAEQVAAEYRREYDWHSDIVEVTEEKLNWLLEQSNAWRNRTHESYLYYKNG